MTDSLDDALQRIGKTFAAQPFDATPWLAIGEGMQARLEDDERRMAEIDRLIQTIGAGNESGEVPQDAYKFGDLLRDLKLVDWEKANANQNAARSQDRALPQEIRDHHTIEYSKCAGNPAKRLATIKQRPGVGRLQAICEAATGRFDSETLVIIRGRFCESLNVEPSAVDAMGLEQFADAWASAGSGNSTPTPRTPKQSPKRKSWQSVPPIAESYVQRSGFHGLKALARDCECHHKTLRKAIDRSDKLRMAEQKFVNQKKTAIPKRRQHRINAVLADSLTSKADDATESIATDDLFQRAIDAAEPGEKRDTLLKMSPAERRAWVATVFDDDPDAEFSFAKPKRVPGRARVKHEKPR